MGLPGNPCNCCSDYPCNYTIDAENKSALANKCGFPDMSTPAIYNLVWTHCEPGNDFTETYTPNADGSCDGPATTIGDCPNPGGVTDYYSEPDTTAAVQARAQTIYDNTDWVSGSVNPQIYIPIGEEYVMIAGERIRIKHAPSATCYLKAWYRVTSNPDGGSPSVGSWTEFYTWIGSGNPCLDGCTDGTDQCITGSWMVFDPPGAPGYNVVDIAVSCDPNFTPT